MKGKDISKLISKAIAISESDPNENMGFVARLFIQVALPHGPQPGNEYVRQNGDFKLSILAPQEIGLPYGVLPRFLLAWITTEAVRNKSKVLFLGDRLSDFLR